VSGEDRELGVCSVSLVARFSGVKAGESLPLKIGIKAAAVGRPRSESSSVSRLARLGFLDVEGIGECEAEVAGGCGVGEAGFK